MVQLLDNGRETSAGGFEEAEAFLELVALVGLVPSVNGVMVDLPTLNVSL
jgi:hypothetical protein